MRGAGTWEKSNRYSGPGYQQPDTIADYFLLRTAANSRQAKAIADYLLEENEQKPLRMEGYQEGRWILLDYGALIVHIFQEEEREYYNLERLWGDAEKEEL